MQFRPFLLSSVFVVTLMQGCSFSTSSTSSESSSGSSDSSSNSSTSSSNSSTSSSEEDKKYENQIMNYTLAYLTTAEYDRLAFLKGISEIATENGITSWEDNQATLIGIGRGLKKSGMTGSVYETYKQSIANSNELRMLSIDKGYDIQ